MLNAGIPFDDFSIVTKTNFIMQGHVLLPLFMHPLCLIIIK